MTIKQERQGKPEAVKWRQSAGRCQQAGTSKCQPAQVKNQTQGENKTFQANRNWDHVLPETCTESTTTGCMLRKRKIIPKGSSEMKEQWAKELANMGVNINQHWLYQIIVPMTDLVEKNKIGLNYWTKITLRMRKGNFS